MNTFEMLERDHDIRWHKNCISALKFRTAMFKEDNSAMIAWHEEKLAELTAA